MSIPSYSPCATRIVRFEPKESFFAASCWSVDVVNGAEGFFRRSRRLTSVTGKLPMKGPPALGARRSALVAAAIFVTSATIALACFSLPISGFLPST